MALMNFLNRTIFDHGAVQQLATVLTNHGITRPLLCTDQGLVRLGMVRKLADQLGNDFPLSIFDGTPENPTQDAVLEAVARYRRDGCDGAYRARISGRRSPKHGWASAQNRNYENLFSARAKDATGRAQRPHPA